MSSQRLSVSGKRRSRARAKRHYAVFCEGILLSLAELIILIFAFTPSLLALTVCGVANILSFAADYSLILSSDRPDEYNKKKARAYANVLSNTLMLIGGTVAVFIALQNIISPHAVNLLANEILSAVAVVISVIEFSLHYAAEKHVGKRSVKYYVNTFTCGMILLVFSVVATLTRNSLFDSIACLAIVTIIVIDEVFNFSYIVKSLTEGANRDSSYHGITRELLNLPHVKAVHHLHIWTYKGGKTMLVAHIKTSDAITDRLVMELKSMVKGVCQDNGIDYSSVQIEPLKEEKE